MRRFMIATALLLAGCATKPEQPPVEPQPVPVAPPSVRQVTHLTGLTVQDLVGHFGKPALQIREGTSLKLQFRDNYCILDAYLYPGQNGALRVTYIDARNASGADIDQASCISALEYPS